MTDLTNKEKSKELSDTCKVTGSVIYRMVSPEDRKKLKKIAKDLAREKGLIVNVIEK